MQQHGKLVSAPVFARSIDDASARAWLDELHADSRLRQQRLGAGTNSSSSDITDGFVKCSSPATFSNLTEGKWGLTLRAHDAAGLVEETRWAPWPSLPPLFDCHLILAKACSATSPGA